LVLSMEDPSTIRRAVADIGSAPYGGDSRVGQTGGNGESTSDGTMYPICSQFAICSFLVVGTGLFRPSVAQFELGSGLI
jgi:hypothetical protein